MPVQHGALRVAASRAERLRGGAVATVDGKARTRAVGVRRFTQEYTIGSRLVTLENFVFSLLELFPWKCICWISIFISLTLSRGVIQSVVTNGHLGGLAGG